MVAVGVAAVALATTPATSRAGDFVKSTYQVPVTQPDEVGAPVVLETDVYLPTRPPPRGGFPFVYVFHGGGSRKDNPYDSGYAEFFARHGYASILYSQRGHGGSSGQTAVAGPKEMRDLFDVMAWALGTGGRDQPAHPDFHIDRRRIGLLGYSQGGLNTNVAQIWHRDESFNPYGIRFRVLGPGNTPDRVFQALVPHQVVKLSFGVGLIATYTVNGSTQGRIAPVVSKWIALTAVDQPDTYGDRLCDASVHDTLATTMKQDLAFRSVGCFANRMTLPTIWAQAFDDELFPPSMAIRMWRLMPNRADKYLYLDMAGHGAPSGDPGELKRKMQTQLAVFDHVLRGRPLDLAPVTFWTRDPEVEVPADHRAYPKGAWYHQTAQDWPPRRIGPRRYLLSGDGRAVRRRPTEADLTLTPVVEDVPNDPVVAAALSGTPLGTSPLESVPSSNVPGSIASFATTPFPANRELDGPSTARLDFTPASPDVQVVVQLYDQAPDDTLTLLGRGVQGLRGIEAGKRRTVTVRTADFSALIHRKHRLVAWVMAGNATFYKPYPDSDGGVLHAGRDSTLTVPLGPTG